MTKKKIGEVLVEKNLVSQENIDQILKEQKHTTKLIGELLVERQFLSEILLYQALAHQHHMGFIDLEAHRLNTAILHKIPLEMAEKNLMVALELKDGTLTLGVSNPRNHLPLEEIKKLTGAVQIQEVLCLPDQIREVLHSKY